jgi:hypothetical protein
MEEPREARLWGARQHFPLAELGDPPFVEDQDAVCPFDGRQPVGDDDAGAAGEEATDGALEQLLGGRIEPRGCLVEDNQAWIFEEDAGQCDELRLTGG